MEVVINSESPGASAESPKPEGFVSGKALVLGSLGWGST